MTHPPGAGAWLALLLPATAAALYLAGWGVLRRRRTAWPRTRLLAAAGGLTVAAAALSPPLVAGTGEFPWHVAQHLALVMLAPLLLACSAPVTLALRTLPRRPRRGLLRVLHSAPLRVLTAPAVVVPLELGSLAALYLTPLSGLLHASPLAHVLVHEHMVLTGCLVSWLLIGADPMPRRLSTPARAAVLVLLSAGHGVLAKLLYAHPPAGLGAADEVRAGAELLYYGGDAIELVLAVAVMAEWYRRTGRRLRAEQRRALSAPVPTR
ncbi:Cytochrome c oxidase assembly factor CtaG [Modestobacter sp. DSM 44400]|uniref:cytochrome c oxidase assembly protein n=1 Tax=Modestobacter sp. DSM 44400 TaxID=1550230 RepID=UPI000899F602|nr:cytochrome c oxidase assembly protein [Modestobacter sp. DSM 44400]SDX59702.1 Cytochrome c oxidase assembly factor CtaG [Modestobacter sp. DSM 44400]